MEKVRQTSVCETLLSRAMILRAKEQPLQGHRRQLLHEATTTIPTAWQATIMGQRPQQRLQEPEKVIFQAAPGELVGPGNSRLRSYPK
jgi:hypothetical protein